MAKPKKQVTDPKLQQRLDEMSEEELAAYLVEEARLLNEAEEDDDSSKDSKKKDDSEDDEDEEDDLDEADAKSIQMAVNDKGTAKTPEGLKKVVVLKSGSERYEVQEVGADGNPKGLPFKINKINVTPSFLGDTDYTEDLDALVNGTEGLTEDFKEKSAVIFEAALSTRLRAEKTILAEQYQVALQEETTEILESLSGKIDKYLTYAVEAWVNDNAVAIDGSLRTEIAESFMASLKSVFTEHYVEVPDNKRDLVDELEKDAGQLKESLAEVNATNISLLEELQVLRREKIIAEASSDLADTQAAKLAELVEDTEFVDTETFTAKVATIKEAYFTARKSAPSKIIVPQKKNTTVTTITEGFDTPTSTDPLVAASLAALKRANRR